jgi:outer membrane receptor protein involved in Fe transport
VLQTPFLILITALGLQSAAAAQDLRGHTLPEAIELLRGKGLRIVYSSALIRDDMRVPRHPEAPHARAQLEEILRPYGLAASEGPDALLIIVRANTPEKLEPSRHRVPDVTVVIVEASRYELVRDADYAAARIGAAEIRSIPNLGEDPLRALARLPGTANNDFSARLNIRGGDTDETLVRLDGMRLHNPFHLKDFQSLFSAIDTSFVDSVDVYTGAFPAHLGDRMSGVIDIRSAAVRDEPQRELSLSLFHGSGLMSGRSRDGETDWLVSARRGNLDLLLDLTSTELGRPRYLDAFARIAHRLSERTSVTGSFLGFNDDIRLNDSDFEERARATYRDRYLWLTLDHTPTDRLSMRMLLSRTVLESERSGSADQAGIGSGTLFDERSHSVDSIGVSGTWLTSEAVSLIFGADWRQAHGKYRYADEAEFDMLFLTSGAATSAEREHALVVQPLGDQYGFYSSLRLEPRSAWTMDFGVRWDRSTLPATYDAEFSPRANVLYEWNDRTRVRIGWGRYAQMQSIDELQVADGIADFFPAQRSEHWILSFERILADKTSLRLELYRKDYDSLRPRYENLLDTMVLLPELKPDRIRIAPSSARAEGIEVSIRHSEPGALLWWASYAWTRVRDRLDAAPVPRSWDQEHAASAGLAWRNPHWQLSVAATYHSGWPSSSVQLLTEEPLPIAVAQRNSERLRSYFDVDLRIARDLSPRAGESMTVFFELSNVLNRRNDCCIEYEFEDEDGEQFLELETLNGLPLLPSLGFTYRF